MLFLIYGPRLFGSLFLDFTVLPVIWLAIPYIRDNLNLVIPYQFINIFLFFGLIICSAIIISIVNMTYDFIHIFKLLRAIISGIVLIIFCYLLIKRGVSRDELIEIYIWAVILHSAIVIAQNINPQIDEIFTMISGYTGYASRPTGLTWSLNASAIPSAFAIFILSGQKKLKYLKIFFIALPMFMMGKTTFLLTILILIISLLRYINFKQFIFLLVFCVAISFFIDPIINYLLTRDDLPSSVYAYLQIAQLLLGQISFEEASRLSELYKTLLTFIFFPSDTTDLLLGAGLSGRESIILTSDMGWILNIWSFGIIGVSILVCMHLYLISLSRNTKIFEAVLLVTVLIFLVNFKENLLFARHVTSVFYISLIYILYPSFQSKIK